MSKAAFAALTAEFEERPLPLPTLVTLHDDDEVGLAAGEVRVVPAWRWLLERP